MEPLLCAVLCIQGKQFWASLEGHVAEEYNLAGMVRAWGTKSRWPLSMGREALWAPVAPGHLYGHRQSELQICRRANY